MTSFNDLELPEILSNGLDKIGFAEPTKVQARVIPKLIENKNLVVCAETGSGKTAAYLIPIIKKLLDNQESRCLVMAPTRELVQQIAEFFTSVMPKRNPLHATRLVGGQDIRKQLRSLEKQPRIIFATPGRLIDHLKKKSFNPKGIDTLVLDEGDRMIDMGFGPQIRQVFKFLPEDRQSCFFTATLDDNVSKMVKEYIPKPETLKLSQARPVSKIKQSVVLVDFKDKDECVLNEINQRRGSVIIFLKTKHRTDRLTKYLSEYGVPVDLIHGGRTQGQRNRAINGFKKGKTNVLCATDVAARGIDIPHVEHVINFDLPMQDEDYVHRVGRTARNGNEGEAISFVTPEETREWNKLVRKYGIPDATVPEPEKSLRRPKKKSSGPSRGKKTSGKKSGHKAGGKKFGKRPAPGRGGKKKSSNGSRRSAR